MRISFLNQKSASIFFLTLLSAISLISFHAWAEGPGRITLETTTAQKVGLTVGKSVIIGSPDPVKRVSVVAPEIADALVLTAHQIYLVGKAPGVTNLTLWSTGDKVFAILDLEVSPDVSRLKETLQKLLPEEKDVTITATHDSITLSGTVSNTSNLEQVLKLAEPFFPKKVVNLLKVKLSDQEISRLRESVDRMFPEERDLTITATQEKIALAGAVSGKSRIDQIMALAESYFPGRVVNLMQVRQAPPPPNRFLSNVSRFKEALYKIVSEEKDIRVIPDEETITLSGTVSSAANLSQVLSLAESYFPKERERERVINLLEVGGVQQVMLEVRVSEMSRSLLRRLGFNFSYVSSTGKVFGISLLNKLTGTGFPGGAVTPSPSSNIDAIFQFLSHGTTWTTFIDALKEEGLLKILAEPTLITLSGKRANFLAGGEFPVPVPQAGSVGAATVTIEYKPFGVGLNFTPVVLSSKKINMEVVPEVSELDFSNAITISGFTIPSLTTRRVSTTVELNDGQSFAIAGLLKDEMREIISKFPVLGDIPILGALFRSSSYQKNDTELIVIVTPHLVKPLDLSKQTLPTDQFIEPDDFEFYLLGNLEGKEKIKSLKSSSGKPDKKLGLEGDFGHIVPK